MRETNGRQDEEHTAHPVDPPAGSVAVEPPPASNGDSARSLVVIEQPEAMESARSPSPNVAPLVPVDSPDTFETPGFTAIGPVPAERKARDHALVLQSMSVWHAIRKWPGGWVLLVRNEDYTRARHSIERYEVENRDWPPPRRRERPRFEASIATPLIFLALVSFFVTTGPVSAGSGWFTHGSSVSDLVVHREPWRVVTALTLHADSVHVLGNAISGTVFASALARRIGPGGSALAVLGSGIIGNFANAVWHQSTIGQHLSIGASTAIFGAIGLLAATQIAIDRPEKAAARTWLDFATPLVGGLALLGALGSSANADLFAHLFGFLGGCVLGLGIVLIHRLTKPKESYAVAVGERVAKPWVGLASTPPRAWVQGVLGAIAAAIVIGSWVLAWTRGVAFSMD